MALNIAVPISSVGDLLEGFGLLSPISPVSIDFRTSLKTPLSPVGSESSGVSSLDLEDIKKQIPSTPTLPEENEDSSTSSGSAAPSSDTSSLCAASTISTTSSRTCSTSSSSSSPSSDDEINNPDQNDQNQTETSNNGAIESSPSPPASLGSGVSETNDPATVGTDEAIPVLSTSPFSPEALETESTKKLEKVTIFHEVRRSIYYGNRDILDLGSNLRNTPGNFTVQYAELPETDNIQFFLKNRSQYHRLGPNGHVQEFRLATCPCCDFKYPVNAVSGSTASNTFNPNGGAMNLSNLNVNQIYGNLVQQQQQQLLQQQQQQQQQRLRLQQQQQQQLQYAYRYNNNNGNGMGRDNMYQQNASTLGGNGNSAGMSSSRYSGASSANVQAGSGNGAFYNNALGNSLVGRDQSNQMATMAMQYNSIGGTSKGMSQSNGPASQLSTFRQQQQQYELLQHQKQYGNNFPLNAAANSSANQASMASTMRLQQQQQQQQQHQHSSQYYKKNQTMRYGGLAGAGFTPSTGPNGGSNWKNQMNIHSIHDAASKLLELNKGQQQQQQQQQSPFYVPFL